jgi:hypothetical protein
MPARSASQMRLMQAAARSRGGYGGVPQKVGKDFVKADKAEGVRKESQLPERVKKSSLRSDIKSAMRGKR